MVIGRRVSKRKGQQLVALPPELRARMGVIPGQWLYFHLGRKVEVVLSTSPARAGGQPPTASLETALTHARARTALLERQLANVYPAALRQARNEFLHHKLGVELAKLPVVEAINDRLRRLEDQLGVRRGPWLHRAKRARPRGVETYHLPEPPAEPPAGSTAPAPAAAETPAPTLSALPPKS